MIAKNLVYLICVLALSPLAAKAGSLQCASADANMAYSFHQNDGGAHIGSTTLLKLGEETLISNSPFGETPIESAKIEFFGKEQVVDLKKTKSYEYTWFTQNSRIISNENNKVVFQEVVMCKRSRYVGVPRP